jgi:hypothetical protein
MSQFSRLGSRSRRGAISGTPYLILALIVLVACWFICFFVLTNNLHLYSISPPHSEAITPSSSTHHDQRPQQQEESHSSNAMVRNLSRSGNVIATADVRGNLGPASVVVQQKPGTDWLHDRWQAASNMHGKNIPGKHLIQLEFPSNIIIDSITLDWETAYASDYRIEGSLQPITSSENNEERNDTDEVWTIFDGTDPTQQSARSETKSGQSPGVKAKMPLHVVHTIHPISDTAKKPVRYVRLHILKSVTGWGVSLWQFDVFGLLESEAVMK